MSEFAIRLKSIRARRNLSQADLARLLGVSNGLVGNWESGINVPRPHNLSKIAEKLSVSVGYLSGFADEDSPKNTIAVAEPVDQPRPPLISLLSDAILRQAANELKACEGEHEEVAMAYAGEMLAELKRRPSRLSYGAKPPPMQSRAGAGALVMNEPAGGAAVQDARGLPSSSATSETAATRDADAALAERLAQESGPSPGAGAPSAHKARPSGGTSSRTKTRP